MWSQLSLLNAKMYVNIIRRRMKYCNSETTQCNITIYLTVLKLGLYCEIYNENIQEYNLTMWHKI